MYLADALNDRHCTDMAIGSDGVCIISTVCCVTLQGLVVYLLFCGRVQKHRSTPNYMTCEYRQVDLAVSTRFAASP
jgi:hypothetical protein